MKNKQDSEATQLESKDVLQFFFLFIQRFFTF